MLKLSIWRMVPLTLATLATAIKVISHFFISLLFLFFFFFFFAFFLIISEKKILILINEILVWFKTQSSQRPEGSLFDSWSTERFNQGRIWRMNLIKRESRNKSAPGNVHQFHESILGKDSRPHPHPRHSSTISG